MMGKRLLVALTLALAGCVSEHGGRDDPIATAEAGYQPSLAELVAMSRGFARQNSLGFDQHIDGETHVLSLGNDEITIEAKTGDGGLKIVAVGPVTPASIELANSYIDEAMSVR